MRQAGTASVPAAERTLSILELLSTTKGGLTLPELSRRLGLPKSSTHRLLVTLERRAYLHRNRLTHRYMFGPKLFSVANWALSGLDLREQALPFLKSLVRRSGLTVHMAINEDNEAVLIEKVSPPGSLGIASRVGKRMDLHWCAVGKCLMAYLPEEEFLRLMRERKLTRNNENTIRSVRQMKLQCEEIRRVGYSFEDEEGEIGYRCVGAPVFDHSGNCVAAISVAGTTDQIGPENLASLNQLVRQTALDISKTLGFVPVQTESQSSGVNGKYQVSQSSGLTH
jgi:DNA-binding IclR family transcriptional regulator